MGIFGEKFTLTGSVGPFEVGFNEAKNFEIDGLVLSPTIMGSMSIYKSLAADAPSYLSIDTSGTLLEVAADTTIEA